MPLVISHSRLSSNSQSSLEGLSSLACQEKFRLTLSSTRRSTVSLPRRYSVGILLAELTDSDKEASLQRSRLFRETEMERERASKLQSIRQISGKPSRQTLK